MAVLEKSEKCYWCCTVMTTTRGVKRRMEENLLSLQVLFCLNQFSGATKAAPQLR